jgi:iron complex transport system substrate-binding protein
LFLLNYEEVIFSVKMRILVALVVILGLLAGATIGCQAQFQPGTYTDDMDREVAINEVPERIVSHVPSITEMLFALGLGDRVVGVSDYCDYPEEAQSKPSVGNYFNPSIENIVALEPDLVLTDGHSENIQQLDGLGITYMVIDPSDIDGIYEALELLGDITGTQSEAADLIDSMQNSIADVLDQVEGAPLVRVMYIIDATDPTLPWTAGPGSFVDALITMAGGENIAGQAQGAWIQLAIEEIVNADPEIIILPLSHGTAFTPPEVLEEHPAWQGITAVAEGHIFFIEADLVDLPGPRIVRGLEELASRIIHPELFE